jgi:F-type H+-transporting ATPase subunit gamma
MPSLAELRKKIKGISSTRQITNAMKMVAGARFARAGRQRSDALHYQAEVQKRIDEVLSLGGVPKGKYASLYTTPGAAAAPAAPHSKVGLMVVAADKGLCGDFNNGILRAADQYLKENSGRVAVLLAAGRKAVEHYRNTAGVAHKADYQHFFNRFDFSTADAMGAEALKIYMEEGLCEWTVVHSHFKSRMKQQFTVTRLLPVMPAAPQDPLYRCTMIEPDEEEELLQALLPMHIKAAIYGILRDSFAAELAARMSAMDNATRNAGSLIDSITLEMNKVRQAVITRELAEIIATNEVVK